MMNTFDRYVRQVLCLALAVASVPSFAGAGEVYDLLLQKNRWGTEKPCLDCCVCPDDYCRKPAPCVPKLCLPCCPDYCKKPEPCVPKLCLPCCPDYCKKCQPCIPYLSCRPGLGCAPGCDCQNCRDQGCDRCAKTPAAKGATASKSTYR